MNIIACTPNEYHASNLKSDQTSAQRTVPQRISLSSATHHIAGVWVWGDVVVFVFVMLGKSL